MKPSLVPPSRLHGGTRKQLLLPVVLAVLVVLALAFPIGYVVYESRSSDALVENFRLVRPGMTPAEVERLLGPPHATPSGRDAGHWQYHMRTTLFMLDGLYDVHFRDGVVESTYEDPF
jgi:outer membrane protein assembly factor BamE (lipoprotein component of BamABCDE complex)